jgi:hypothetical protein
LIILLRNSQSKKEKSRSNRRDWEILYIF